MSLAYFLVRNGGYKAGCKELCGSRETSWRGAQKHHNRYRQVSVRLPVGTEQSDPEQGWGAGLGDKSMGFGVWPRFRFRMVEAGGGSHPNWGVAGVASLLACLLLAGQ